MAKNYTGTTRTLDLGSTSYRGTIFKPSKPPLDSELNFLGDLPHQLDELQIRQEFSSGFYPAYKATSIGYDNSGSTYGINLTTTPNQIIVKNLNNLPFRLNILGDTLEVGGTNSSDPSQLIITLPAAASSGSREDLVYLEAWYQQVKPLDTNAKPSSSTVYAYGNLQSGLAPVADDMYFSPIGTSTTDRVQLQYQIRVIPNVNFVTHPDGVDDDLNVFAKASNAAPLGNYTFTRSTEDPGVYIAGDGTTPAQTVLGTVDGYVYAIPLFRIHRRNTAPFTLLNLNGAGGTVSLGVSDRPDGYFYDKVEVSDVEDLRHFITVNPSYQELLENSFHRLLSNTLNTALFESPLGSDAVYNSLGLFVNGMSVPDQVGVDDVAVPNSQRRVISDSLTNQRTITKVQLADRTQVFGITWTIGDQFIINLVGSNPTGTEFGTRVPNVYGVVRSGGVETKVFVPSSVTPLGNTTLVFTLGTIPSGIGNQTLSVDYDIAYPAGTGLTFVPTAVAKVYEVRDNVNYSFVSENDADGLRPGSLVTSASASDIRIGRSTQEGFTTLGYISMNANGTQTYTVGPTHGGVPITHVNAVVVNSQQITRSSSPLKIQQVNLNFDGSISVVFNSAVPINTPMTFSVGLANKAVRVQELTKSITEVGTIEFLSKTILAGQNVTQVSFDADGVIFGAQSEYQGGGVYNDICYVNNVATPCTITVSGNFVTISGLATPLGVLTNDTVQLVVSHAYALDSTQRLQIFYQYVPYQGITSRQSFGTGPNSYVKTKVIAKSEGMLVHTSGTNGLNTTAPSIYHPMIVKLPKAFNDSDSDLANNTLGAKTYDLYKGISLGYDSTIFQLLAFTDYETQVGWTAGNADTTLLGSDPGRMMFGKPTLRFNKTGTSGVIGEIDHTPAASNWSSIIDTSGNVLGGQQLVYWFYVQDPSVVTNVMLQLKTSGGNHVYGVYSGIQTGWNKAVFTTRTEGSATTTTITSVSFLVNFNVPSNTQRGLNLVTPYIELVGQSEGLTDGDIFFSNSDSVLYKFKQFIGMSQISDQAGIAFFRDRSYAFDVPVVGGTNATSSSHTFPTVPGLENYLSMNGVINDRGTFSGGYFYTTGMETITPTTKQCVNYSLEQVLSDPTNNFAIGELVLKVETHVATGTTVEISNSDFNSNNSFDVFRLPGRPLGKIS